MSYHELPKDGEPWYGPTTCANGYKCVKFSKELRKSVSRIHPIRTTRFRCTRFSQGPGRPSTLISMGSAPLLRQDFQGLGLERPNPRDADSV